MKLYTKFGDKGMTSLYGGEIKSKDHIRIEAYGTIDELNAFIGLLHGSIDDKMSLALLLNCQSRLFSIGALLASDEKMRNKLEQITKDDIQVIENEIDRMELSVEPLKNFILPGGSKVISYCHICRTITRRAERRVVSLINAEGMGLETVLVYLNRLSDYFFMLGRFLAKLDRIEEVKWVSKL